MKKLFFLFLLPVAAQAQSGNDFSLKGDLKLSQPVDWVYIRYIPKTGEEAVNDSFQTKDGTFTYKGRIAEPTLATLTVKYVPQPGEARAKRESAPLFLEPASMALVVKDSLKALSLSGSAAHADHARLQKQAQPYMDRMTPLYEPYMQARKEGRRADMKKIEKSLEDIDNEMRQNVYTAFVKSNPKSPVALYALKQAASWDFDPNVVEPLFATLPASVRQWPSAVAFREQIETAKKTAVGVLAMDFTQADTLGVPVSLSSFKGKYVFVDFWASWCGPCRVENPDVVKAFQRFKDRNFTILGVSLDREGQKERWMKAIHDDNLTWTHVSDLKYWDNAVAKQYGIRAIPQNFLVDPSGRIIARNLSGEELEAKLAEVIK
jgi:peroxiredoxin